MGPYSRDDEDLAELRHHWGDAYAISIVGGRWLAQRRDTRDTLTAVDADGLYAAISRDYTRRPVPREGQ